MKKLLTLIVVAGLALTIQAQTEDINMQLNGADDNNAFTIDDGNGDRQFTFYSSGRLGIPSLGGAVKPAALMLTSDTANLSFTSYNETQTRGSFIYFGKARGTAGSPSNTGDNDVISTFQYFARGGGSGFFPHAGAVMEVKNDVINGYMEINFYTGQSTDDTEKRLTIKSDGKVGIGTETPNSTLGVRGSFSLPFNEPTAATYAATATDYNIIPLKECTVTLPDPLNCPGRVYVIKRPGANSENISIISAGNNIKIEGNTSVKLDTAWDFVRVQSVATTWVIIGGNGYTLVP